jgi:3-phytase
MSIAPDVGTTLSGQKVKLGGFSGLQFIEEKNGDLFFETITDRGPNSYTNGLDRPFLLPDYSPRVIVIKADVTSKQISVVSDVKLKKSDGSPLTGLPNNRLEENPIDIFGLYYSVDQMGLDTEGIAKDNEGGWWVADEYGPSLVRFNKEGKMLRRLMPGLELPRMYSDRKPNRGFEAIVKLENKIFGFLQSPLPKELGPNDGNFSRIVEVNLETMKTSAAYFYYFEKGNDKIGDAVAISAKTFLVLEQNGKTGEKSQKFIYRITLGDSDQPVSKTLIADLKDTPFNEFEKIEGLALIDDRRIALVNDNDFQINGKTNHATGLTPFSEDLNLLLILEFSENIKDGIGR